jgi:hypothetical protein
VASRVDVTTAAFDRPYRLVPLRNADLCSAVALRLIRCKPKQPKRLASKSCRVQLNAEKKSAFVTDRAGKCTNQKPTISLRFRPGGRASDGALTETVIPLYSCSRQL